MADAARGREPSWGKCRFYGTRTGESPTGPRWGTTTVSATSGNVGTSQRNRAVAEPAPRSCAAMKPGTSAGRIPANVSVADRASVTAGFANEVEAVNQYAAVMYAATANGMAEERSRAQPQTTASRPNVATNSLNAC